MDDIVKYLLASLGGFSLAGVMLLLLLLNPEKIEKWSALLWHLLNGFGTLFKGAHKQYVKHDLQGRVNEFAKGLSGDAPFLAGSRVQIEWMDSEVTKRSFLHEGKVILRLRRDDPEDINFVHGAYMFVSTSLVAKVKRYISPSQRQAVDLYVTTKLLEREKESVRGLFLDQYLHPKTEEPDAKIGSYFDVFAKIDRGGFFYPVLLQELDFLGDKVFGKRRDDKIIAEVNSLIEFLEPIAGRKVGDEGDLTFEQDYCRFGIVIVGKPLKLALSGADIYINYIKSRLIPQKIETVYIRGRWENKHVLDTICEEFADSYEKFRTRRFKMVLRYSGELIERDQYLVVLRMKGTTIFQPSE